MLIFWRLRWLIEGRPLPLNMYDLNERLNNTIDKQYFKPDFVNAILAYVSILSKTIFHGVRYEAIQYQYFFNTIERKALLFQY